MKGSLITGIVLTILPLLSGQLNDKQAAYLQYLEHPWVDSVLATLSMEEKVAQSLWLITSPDDELREIMECAQIISNHGIGGLIFTESPDEQMLELANTCRSFSSIPPVIALEGRWSAHFPDMLSLAAIPGDTLPYLAGRELGAQLGQSGVNLLLAEGMDDAVASGLADMGIQVLMKGGSQDAVECIQRIKTANIAEINTYLEEVGHTETIDQGVRQILALKYWMEQQNPEAGESSLEMPDKGSTAQSAFVRDLYAQSLTVLSMHQQSIPIKDLENTRIACLAVNQQCMTDFQKMAARYTRTDNYFWVPGHENKNELAEELEGYNLVLAGIYPGQDPGAVKAFLSKLAGQTRLVVVWFGDASSLQQFEGISSPDASWEPEALVLCYEQNPQTESLSAQLIFGGIGGSGRLPLAIGDRYPLGSGINTAGGLRLQYGYAENAGLCSRNLNRAIDSIVARGLEAGAYPGCQVIIARKGKVVFQKAYGHHTYDKRVEVRKNDLYDLASVTKVTGPLSGLMLLEGMGKFSYQDRLGDYAYAMKGSDKADLELKDVLAHRAGLYPWIPYNEMTLRKSGKYKKRFLRSDAEGKFNVEVADRLYLSNTFKNKIFKVIRKSELGEKKYRYSGLSFFLFPTAIEDISGQSYETFLTQNIYQRLGAWELLFHPRQSFPLSRIVPTEYDSVFRKQLVHGYVHDEGAAVMGAYAGNAGLFASSNDLLKLIEMYRRMGSYGGEQIIQSEVLREYSSYQFPELESRRGLGFDKPLLGEYDGTADDYPCPGASSASFGHSGFTGTFVWADPEHEISYVFLSNRVYPSRTNQLLYEMNIRTSILQSVYDSIIDP